MKHVTAVGAWALGTCLCAASANADLFNFQFDLEQAQSVPVPIMVPGATGFADVDYDSNTNMLSWNVTFSGMSGVLLFAHFHGPALPGQVAGVQVGISAISGVVSPMIGSTPINELQEADLLAGLWYINLHTSLNQAGEVRGQVIPTPGALVLFAVASGIAIRRRRRL